MSEKTNGDPGVQNAPAHADPALIPAEIYAAEGTLAHANRDMFISSEQLDQMLSPDLRKQMVLHIDRLAALVNEARELVSNPANRRIAIGKGFRNYGFMLAANQSMNNFPELAPNFVNINDFNDVIEDYLFARDVAERTLSLTNDLRDIMNIFGNLGFNFALAYYSNVRSIADRTRDKTAISVFNILQRFFTRKRTPQNSNEPTEMQLERDFKALLHGHKDGEIIVKHESPTTSGRVHEVLDDTHSHRTHDGLKATINEKITE